MKTSLSRQAAIICILFLGTTGLASANLINNGDFQTGNLSGWTVGGSPGGVGVGQSQQFHSDSLGAFFQGQPGFATISQTFATTANALYDLSFYFQIGPAPTADNAFEVLFNGISIYSNLNANPGFSTFTFNNLMATGATTTLEFRGRNLLGVDYLDDVVVNAATGNVPDAGNSLLLMGVALAGLSGARRFLITARA